MSATRAPGALPCGLRGQPGSVPAVPPHSPAALKREPFLQTAGRRFGGHPWPLCCSGVDLGFVAAWEDPTGAAVAWRGPHAWSAEPCVHVLGRPRQAVDLVRAVAEPGEYVITSRDIAWRLDPQITPERSWTLRTVRIPLPAQPGQDRVGWLGSADLGDIAGLLAAANPHPAVWPGDPVQGRWCGVRDDSGRLVACAAETLPAAPVAHLSSLAVHPDARREGLGAAVTAFFVAESLAGGAPLVMLGVDHDNERAARLYDRIGFSALPMAGLESVR